MTIPFKLRQLEMFIAVAEELNFRVAAERLHMTQPPLSRQIRELEQSLAVQLFQRDNIGVSLTEHGKQFLPEARALIAQAERLAASFRAAECPEERSLKVGVTTVLEVATFHQLPSFLAVAMPNCRVEFRPQSSLRSIQDLLKNRLDAAIIGMPSKIGKLNTRLLYRDPLCLALPASHRFADVNSDVVSPALPVSLLALADDALFWFKRERNPGFYDFCEIAFARLGYQPLRLTEPTDHHVLLSMIANQAGVALIPCSMRNLQRTGVVYREIQEQDLLYIEVALAYGDTTNNPILARFVDEMTGFFEAP